MKDDDDMLCIILERLTALEAETRTKFTELDKARELAREVGARELLLARELHDKDRHDSQKQIEYKFELSNQYQKKIDRLENTFVNKDMLEDSKRTIKQFHEVDVEFLRHENDGLKRLVYIGSGICIGLQLVFGFLFIMFRHVVQ